MEMSGWRAVFEADMYRYGASKVDKYIKKWNYFFRRCQYASGGKKIIWHLLLLKHGTKHGIEIDYPVKIGNPAKIIKKENATDSYITMRI